MESVLPYRAVPFGSRTSSRCPFKELFFISFIVENPNCQISIEQSTNGIGFGLEFQAGIVIGFKAHNVYSESPLNRIGRSTGEGIGTFFVFAL